MSPGGTLARSPAQGAENIEAGPAGRRGRAPPGPARPDPEVGDGGLLAYRALWWGHALLSLGLIAYTPWSKLRHALLAPVTLTLRPDAGAGQSLGLDPVDAVDGAGNDVAGRRSADDGASPEAAGAPATFLDRLFGDACVWCGRCDAVCPSHLGAEPLSPRDCVQAARAGRLNDAPFAAQAWYCTTCGACTRACPLALCPLDVIGRARGALVESGQEVPVQLAEGLERLYKYQNPWLAKKGQKAAWQAQAGVDLPDLSKKGAAELLYFVGCTTSLDTRAQGIARALAQIFAHADARVGTLGKREPCCGDVARRCAEAGLFEEQREATVALLDKHRVGALVTSSPHCWDTMAYAAPRRVEHYTQLLDRWLAEGRLRTRGDLERRVTFHDPCFLARHNGVVDEPRRLIRATGATLVEMAAHGEESLCCGGGGGRMWQELPQQGDLAARRLEQARATGADAVITACPLCLIMLEDARKTTGLEAQLEIIDLAELLASALIPQEA